MYHENLKTKGIGLEEGRLGRGSIMRSILNAFSDVNSWHVEQVLGQN